MSKIKQLIPKMVDWVSNNRFEMKSAGAKISAVSAPLRSQRIQERNCILGQAQAQASNIPSNIRLDLPRCNCTGNAAYQVESNSMGTRVQRGV